MTFRTIGSDLPAIGDPAMDEFAFLSSVGEDRPNPTHVVSDDGPALAAAADLRADFDTARDAAAEPLLAPMVSVDMTVAFGEPVLAEARGGGGGGDKGGKPGSDPGPTDPVVLTYYKAGGNDKGRSDKYNIEIDFLGDNWTTDIQKAFVDAADYITSVITQGIGDVFTMYVATGQLMIIDDIRFTAEIAEIDGISNTLAYAGPYPSSQDLPNQGLMVLDAADVPNLSASDLYAVVLHEMFHVLGFGTYWGSLGLVSTSATSPDQFVFTGAAATAEYEAGVLYGTYTGPTDAGGVPIEAYTDADGNLQPGGHWAESVYTKELMTPYLDSPAQLTLLSWAAMEDMGYSIDYGATGLLTA